MERNMDKSEWETEFFRRWREIFEYEARGFEACLNDSYHSAFAKALAELEVFLADDQEPVDMKVYSRHLLERLLAAAALSPKLDREWLNYGDTETELDTDSFYLTDDVTKPIENRLSAFYSTGMQEMAAEDKCYADFARMFVNDLIEFYEDVMPGLHAWQLGTPEGMSEAHFFWHLSPWHWTGHLLQAIRSLNAFYYYEPTKP